MAANNQVGAYVTSINGHNEIGEAGAAARKRVRTPGKHIVLFALAVTFILTLATTAIRSGRVALPDYVSGAATADYSLAQEFIVDLAPDSSGRTGFLKLRMTILAPDKAALSEVEDKGSQIRERISFFLRELSSEDFAGTEAAERVKAELLKRARLPVSGGAVKDVVIDELVIQ